jgi:hypothetical protein
MYNKSPNNITFFREKVISKGISAPIFFTHILFPLGSILGKNGFFNCKLGKTPFDQNQKMINKTI